MHDDLLVVVGDDGLGIEGDFSSAAGCVEDVLGDGVARGVAAKLRDEFESGVDGCP